ncbi:MAG: BamA/TamA family outer membrane protein, partial [Spirochaetota bacterium]
TTDEITRARNGLGGEFAIEWGPSFLHNQLLSSSDYTRLTLSARGYLPLYEVEPAEGMNVFSSYLAGFGSVDWATGPEIPLSVRQTTGGRSIRSAPGGSVRGYASGRFDATLKAIGNVEIRNNLPAIVWPGLVPGIVLYTDTGYYLDTLATSPVADEHSGFLLSSGAGVSLELFGVASFVFYTNYLWTATSVDGERWIPFSLGFGYHY